MPLPVFDLSRAPPGRLTMPYKAGGAVEGGRSQSNIVMASDMTGGGLLMVKYSALNIGNVEPAHMRYVSQLSGILNNGVRSIIVPMLVDFIQPSGPALFTMAPSLAGGVVFETPSADNPDTINPAALSAGTVTLNVGSRRLTGGEWFEVVHPTKLNRAYQVTDIDAAVTAADGSQTVTVGIDRPLREAITSLTAVNFTQPKNVMRLAPGTSITIDVQNYWWATPDISFIESTGPFF